MKKRKEKTTSQLKKELDSLFSKFIRLSYADQDGFVSCYTCPKRTHWKDIQNGHFISRGYLATRFSEDNCRPQCVGCNMFGGGKQVEFSRKLELEQKGITIRLYREAQKTIKNFPYKEKILFYREKLSEFPLFNAA